MTIESTIISFITLCTCLVAANIALFPRRLNLDREKARKSRIQEKALRMFMDSNTGNADAVKADAYWKRLRRRLRRPDMLMAYVETAERVLEEYGEEKKEWYLKLAVPVFSRLCSVYEKKSMTMMTCFVYVLGRMLCCGMEPDPRIWEFLYVRLRSESLVCRQNAFSAIFSAGDAEKAVRAVLYMNRTYETYNDKLITEGMLRFEGELQDLAERLWKIYDGLNNDFKLAVLNFLRLSSDRYSDRMLAVLQDATADKELHYAVIRYLGKYPDEAARPVLLSLLEKDGRDTWVYAAVSAQALGAYPGEDTFDALKKALFSPDWYLRLNASASLERLGIDYLKLSDVINSSDRYAREMAQYRLEETESGAEG